jgi:hypothetical protein
MDVDYISVNIIQSEGAYFSTPEPAYGRQEDGDMHLCAPGGLDNLTHDGIPGDLYIGPRTGREAGRNGNIVAP